MRFGLGFNLTRFNFAKGPCLQTQAIRLESELRTAAGRVPRCLWSVRGLKIWVLKGRHRRVE